MLTKVAGAASGECCGSPNDNCQCAEFTRVHGDAAVLLHTRLLVRVRRNTSSNAKGSSKAVEGGDQFQATEPTDRFSMMKLGILEFADNTPTSKACLIF